ncbi:MAG: hypothetical protein U0787_02325 [Polyangia bacterium]
MKSTSPGPVRIELDSATWASGIIDCSQNQSLGKVPDQTGPFVVLTRPARGIPTGNPTE